MRPPAKCGTDGGYYRHRRVTKTDACRPCLDAHARAKADREARRLADGTLAPLPALEPPPPRRLRWVNRGGIMRAEQVAS